MQNRLRQAGKGVALFDCKIQDWDQPCKTITAHLAKDVDLAHPGSPANHGPVPSDSVRVLQLIAQADSNGVIPLEALKSVMPSRVGSLKGRQKTGAWHKPNPTITAQAGFYAGAHYHPNVAQPRRFTVRECARIQSFQDDFVFTGRSVTPCRQSLLRLAHQIAKAFASGE